MLTEHQLLLHRQRFVCQPADSQPNRKSARFVEKMSQKSKVESGRNNVTLFSAAWYGDKEITLNFPASWEVTVVGDRVHPALNDRMIRATFDKPIDSPCLSGLAAGKSRVAVIVDDITRPTPSAALIPFILEDLRSAGIQDEAITIFVAGGTHSPAASDEIIKKTGSIPPAINVISHDCKKDLEYLGKTSGGTPVYINQAVMLCDLKIGIGCIYPHASAGFSGGSKIIMPGMCGLETARYAHRTFQKAKYRGDSSQTDFRREMEGVAQKVGLDFIVNAVLNQKRQIAGLFAGDRVTAHQAGMKLAAKLYQTQVIEDADVVIADAYPFDVFLLFAYNRGLWPVFEAKDNATTIVIAACSRGIGYHELSSRTTPIKKRIVRRLKNVRLRDLYKPIHSLNKVARFLKKRNRALMILSQGITPEELNPVFPQAKLYKNWDALLPELKSRHKNSPVKVAVYRCAPLLIPNRQAGFQPHRHPAKLVEEIGRRSENRK